MPYPIDKKLVIAVASSALFDLSESHKVYREEGVDAYREYQEKNIDNTLGKGVAFPFIKRLLKLNAVFHEEQPVEVVLLSRNSPETGLRVFRSIQYYGLDISRAAFFSGSSPYKYLPAFNASLFLSAEENDVRAACDSGFAAGRVLNSTMEDDDDDELRIAFDFDGVIASDSAEKVYQNSGMEAFHQSESDKADIPLEPGLLTNLFARIALFQMMESRRIQENPTYKRILKTAIVTARNAPAHERLINTLKKWGVDVDEAFFLGGIEKSRILDIMHPHIFFDDQLGHLSSLQNIPAVHIPFGIINSPKRMDKNKKENPYYNLNQVIAEYFRNNPGIDKVQVKELMPDFIKKGIFSTNHRDGLPIRKLLRELEKEGKLDLIPSVLPEKKKVNTNWFFIR